MRYQQNSQVEPLLSFLVMNQQNCPEMNLHRWLATNLHTLPLLARHHSHHRQIF